MRPQPCPTPLFLALVVVLAAVLAGCAEPGPGGAEPATTAPAPTDPGVGLPEPGQPLATCDGEERPPLQGGQHLVGDAEPPVPYSSTPPTSGWHASGAFEIAVQAPDDPLSEPRQVSVLEAGGVVVAYRDLPEAERLQLEAHVLAEHDGRVAVTPYGELDAGQVAFTAWGLLQRCQGIDLAALDRFVQAHAEPDPTPGHDH